MRKRLCVHEAAGAFGDRIHDFLGRRDRRQRRVAAGDPLPQRHDVGRDAVRLDRPPRAGAAHTHQHLVGDEQDVVAVADLPHAAEVLGTRRRPARGRAADRLGDERGHVLGAEPGDGLFQHIAAADGTRRTLTAAFTAIGIRGRDAVHVDEPGAEHCLVRFACGCGQGEQGAAVVAGAEGDDAVLVGAAALDPVLARQFQRGLDRLRPTTEEVQPGQVARERLGQLVREILDRAVGEHRAREIAILPALLGDRIGDLGVRVADVGDVRAADGIEVALAALVDEPAPLAAHDLGILVAELAVEDVAGRVAV